MTYQDIIKAKINTEGLPLSQEQLLEHVLQRIESGYTKVFQYGNMVITVSMQENLPLVHVYSLEKQSTVLRVMHQFLEDVWRETSHTFLLAPIKNATLAKVVLRLGSRMVLELPLGYKMYMLKKDLT